MNGLLRQGTGWISILVVSCGAPRLAADSVWFDDLPETSTPAVTLEQAQSVLRALRRNLESGEPFAAPVGLPKTASIVFLSASDGQAPARVVHGAAPSAAQAIEAARSALRKVLPATEKTPWLRLDVVRGRGRELGTGPSYAIDRSLEGLAFPERLGDAFLAEELVANTVIDRQGILHRRAVYRTLLRRGIAPLRRGRTRTCERCRSARFGAGASSMTGLTASRCSAVTGSARP